MANEVEVLLIKYASDISQLQASAETVVSEFRKMTGAAESSSKAIADSFSKQVSQADVFTKRLAQLQVARDNSQGDPQKVERINALIKIQEGEIEKISTFGGVKIIDPSQVALINTATVRLQQLKVARDASEDPTRTERINQLISQQSSQIQKLSVIKPAQVVDPVQIGLIENMRNRLNQLTAARDRANDPAKVQRLNGLIAEQSNQINNLTQKTKKANEAGDESERIGNKIRNLAERIVAIFAVREIVNFGIESVKAFAAAEVAATKLNFAVTKVLGETVLNVEELTQQSEILSATSFFSPRQIQEAQTLQAQFGLTSKQVKELTPVILNLAVAQGTDLASATDTVLRAIEGQSRGLKTIGADFKDTGTAGGNYNKVIENLSKLNGLATEALNTTSGAMKNQEKEVEILQEQLGQKAAPILLAFKSFLIDAGTASVDFATDVSKVVNIFGDLFTFDFSKLGQDLKAAFGFDAGTSLQTFIDNAIKGNAELKESFIETFKPLSKNELEDKLNVTEDLLSDAKERLAEATKNNDQIAKELATSEVRNLAIQGTALNELIRLRNEGVAAEKEYTLKVTGFSKERIEQELKELEERKKTHSTKEVEDLIKVREEELKKILDAEKKVNDQLAKSREDASKKLAELDKKINDDLLKAKGQNALEVLAAEKQIAEQEVQIAFDASQKTIKDKENLNDALLKLEQEFGIKAEAIRFKNRQQAAKDNEAAAQKLIDDTKKNFENISSALDLLQAQKTVTVKQNFITTGDNSPEARRKLEEDLLNIQVEFDDKRLNEQKNFVKDFTAQEELLNQSLRREADVLKNRVAFEFFSKGDFSLGAFATAEAQIEVIDKNTGDAIKKNAQDVTDATNNLQKQQTENAGNEADKRLKISEDEAKKKIDLEKEILNVTVSGIEDLISNILKRQTDERLKSIQEVHDAELTAIDESISANDDKLKKGIIGDREAQKNKEQLLQRKKQADDKAAAQEKAIKRKQFQEDQFAAVAKVVIANIINAAQFPLLAELYAALAVIQTGLILAEPNPYKKGSKSTKEGLSLVGEEGPELIHMPGKSQVLPATQTKQNAELIDAMFDNKLMQHIHKVYIEPALIQQARQITNSKEYVSREIFIPQSTNENIGTVKNITIYKELFTKELQTTLNKLQISTILSTVTHKYEEKKRADFANNIATSILIHKESANDFRKDLREVSNEMRKKGTYFNNVDDIVEPIVEALKPLKKPSFKR